MAKVSDLIEEIIMKMMEANDGFAEIAARRSGRTSGTV